MKSLSDNLVGLFEIAQRAGVQRPAVTMWRSRHKDFPQPVAELKVGPIFWWPDIKKWLEETGRDSNQNWEYDQIVPHKRHIRSWWEREEL